MSIYDDTIMLGQNNYGKSDVRIVKVKRDTPLHEIWDLNVRVALEGDFSAAHVGSDNSLLLATDTMRNTVYALAKDHLSTSIESFGLVLVEHFLKVGPNVTKAWIECTQYPWERIRVEGKQHEHAFVRAAGERYARVTADISGSRQVEAGLGNITIMKTTSSGWEQFYREAFTTLPDTNDRILATVVSARWVYAEASNLDFDKLWNNVYQQLLSTFTDHYSPSMQHTLFRIGKAILEKQPEIAKIWLSFPNKHHLLYDLKRFGIENNNEIFHATSEPYGQIEGWVERHNRMHQGSGDRD